MGHQVKFSTTDQVRQLSIVMLLSYPGHQDIFVSFMAPQHHSFGQNLNFFMVDKFDVLENIIYMYVLSGHDFTQTWEILR